MAQARRKKSPKLQRFFYQQLRGLLRGAAFAALLLLALLLAVALVSFDPRDPGWTYSGAGLPVANWVGAAGAWIADLALYFFGYGAYLLPPGLALAGWRLFRRSQPLQPEFVFFRLLGVVVGAGSACALAELTLAPISATLAAGGIVGVGVSRFLLLQTGFGLDLAGLLLALLLLGALSLITDRSWLQMAELLGKSIWLLTRAALAPLIPLRAGEADAGNRVAPGGRFSALADGWHALREQMTTLLRVPVSALAGAAARTDAPAAKPRRAVKKPAPASAKRDERREPVIGAAGPSAADDDGAVVAAPQTRTRTARKTVKPPEPADADDAWAEIAPSGGADGPRPPLTLLEMAPDDVGGYSSAMLDEMSARLKALLLDFGIDVEVVNAIPGPVITRFELDPARGVKGNQISNLAKDLARGLAVVSVRIEEIIPGKPYIGLEIPNQQRQVVFLSEILGAPIYRKSPSPLTLTLGKDIAGNALIADLASMPHLLVAGTTGSGKSVSLNTMLLSMLYKATPADVRLILIDPKMLELSIYEGIPHLLAPVVTDMNEAANALRWCTHEMERRYKLMSALKVRHIRGYNAKVNDAIAKGKPLRDPLYAAPDGLENVPTLEPLPYVVVVIDELADMMMTVGKKVEELIVRLAQKARAAGIHLILATQRPSVDVITGLIKSNIPARMAFQVASKIDSRTILDQMGAESLLGHGDMLLLGPQSSGGIPQRVHGAFVNDHEVQRVVEFLRSAGSPDYSDDILAEPEPEVSVGADGLPQVDGETDPLYDQAVRVVLDTRRASISSLQRRLGIGYNRSARIIEAMENAGLLSAPQSNGAREILARGAADETE